MTCARLAVNDSGLACALALSPNASAYSVYGEENPFVEAMLRMMEIFGLIDRSRLPPGVPYLPGYGHSWTPGIGSTTGMIGYFQRILAKGLLPPVPVVSAHPMISYPQNTGVFCRVYELLETRDKGNNTGKVARSQAIPAAKIILLGDSGGDGPHFEWGAAAGAYLIGSMTKPSLEKYCRTKAIEINLRFGLHYTRSEALSLQKELQINFMDLTDTIVEIMKS